LREETLALCEEKTIEEANELLAGCGGKLLEALVEFETGAAGRYGLKVCATPDGAEETLLVYDSAASTLTADRHKSSLTDDFDKKTVGGELPLAGQPLQLHVFIDHSMLEVYASQLKSLTTRVYPTRSDAVGLRLWADNPVKVKKLTVWRLGSIYRG
jgi:sucrose-6-phosphate hydrolase SacC (GH32 family)